MKSKKVLMVGLACVVAAVFAVDVRGDAAGEIGRLAELMGWKAGTVAADIGAGTGGSRLRRSFDADGFAG